MASPPAAPSMTPRSGPHSNSSSATRSCAAWLTGRPGRPVRIDDSLDPGLRSVLAAIAALGGAVELSLLPDSACGTTALCLARGDGERWPGVTIGLGADLDPRAAIRQAILELGQTGPYLRRMLRAGALPVPATPADVRQMLDHAAYYLPADRAVAFARLHGDGPACSISELESSTAERPLAACAAALAKSGIRVAVVDVTSPDVATGPFRVVRAVSLDLQPISYGFGFDRLPVPRVRALGLAADLPPIHPIW